LLDIKNYAILYVVSRASRGNYNIFKQKNYPAL